MTKLEELLLPFQEIGKLSDSSFDRDYLRSALAKVSNQTAFAFWVALGAQITLVCTVIGFAIANSHNSRVLGFIFAGGGGGFLACCWASVSFWRQKVASDLLIALVASLDKASAMRVLNVALGVLRQGSFKFAQKRAVNVGG